MRAALSFLFREMLLFALREAPLKYLNPTDKATRLEGKRSKGATTKMHARSPMVPDQLLDCLQHLVPPVLRIQRNVRLAQPSLELLVGRPGRLRCRGRRVLSRNSLCESQRSRRASGSGGKEDDRAQCRGRGMREGREEIVLAIYCAVRCGAPKNSWSGGRKQKHEKRIAKRKERQAVRSSSLC